MVSKHIPVTVPWQVARSWRRRCLVPLLLVTLVFLPAVVLAHAIAEIVAAPATFDRQAVEIVGQVDNIVTRYGDAPYTTFVLIDADDVALPIFIWGIPACKIGDVCHVTGTFVMEKAVGTHVLAQGVEAEKIERVSEAEYKTAGPLFRKKKKAGRGSVSKYLQGFTTIP
jgi:hypothetical protein